MCLSWITKRHKPALREKIAWKAFIRTEAGLILPYFSDGPVERGIWLKAVRRSTGGGYRSGFHAFKYKASAEDYAARWNSGGGVVARVRLRGVRLEGAQIGAACYVADEMCVSKVSR